jgi:hypothetical protein
MIAPFVEVHLKIIAGSGLVKGKGAIKFLMIGRMGSPLKD